MASKNFQITSTWQGYRHKTDITNLPPGVLIVGSQNVISTDGDTIKVRQGYTLDGQENSALQPIRGSYDWLTHWGAERNLRSYDDELEYRYIDSLGAVTWRRLADGFASPNFQFAEFWDTTEESDVLIGVNGDDNLYVWSGGVTTFASATVNTLTKQGVTSWTEEGFFTAGTRQVVLGGITYTYTGGENTTTLTGVTPDPTLGGHSAGDVIHQAIRTVTNTPASGYTNDTVATLNNQLYVGSYSSRQVLKSKVNDYTDYTFSTPRTVGEGALLTLDSATIGFVTQEDTLYITAGNSQWYQVESQLSSDLQNESIVVKRLKSNVQSAANSQASIGTIKNDVAFISQEPTLDTLGRVQQINTPQSVPISDPIKIDFDTLNFDNAHVKYYKNFIYIALPHESLLYIYNLQKGFWEAPQLLPAGRLAIISGELYLHSNSVPETYKLFEGYADKITPTSAGNPISAIARFSYMNFGDRAWQKNFTEWYTEGYISSNTTLTRTLYYDYAGFTDTTQRDILGNDTNVIYFGSSGSLGKKSLGKAKLGGGESGDEFPKFRIYHESPKIDFYEVSPEYSSNGVDERWEIIAFGGNIYASTSDNNPLKQ